MNPYVLFIILSSLGLGTTLTFASSHWLMAWMGLEINTLAILPLMAQKHHPRAVEATTKYFLTQATAAALILFATTTNAWVTGQWSIDHLSHPMATTLTTIALALKIGLAPLHFWLPEVLQGLTLTTGLILSTWQKLAPMALILQMAPVTNQIILTTLGLLSTLIGGWGGLNQTQLRKLLAYSSIAHLGWMVIVLQYAPHLTLLTLIMYILMTSTTFMVFNTYSTAKMITLGLKWASNPTLMAMAALSLLSLGGLPPMTGFMPKWLILQELTKQGLPLTATVIAMSALLSLFFYLRLCYAMVLTVAPNTNNAQTPWRTQSLKLTLPLSTLMVLSVLMLPVTPLMLALMY
uniref:NADH-ubiquinone oxidoreductase chain 2 n=1 Tax=Cromeria nilotica TaxID=299317 RepID=E6N1X9_9TELE|nr:NADH dehydrogenase subunit 2 [Cromeria nilotica]